VYSEGVIKFKLHSDFVMKNERGESEKLTWSAGVTGGERLGIALALEDSPLFLSVFLFAFSSGFLCYALPSPSSRCLFFLFRHCLLWFLRVPLFLWEETGE
jgi:hypothetical protein